MKKSKELEEAFMICIERVIAEQVYELVKKYGGVLTDDRHFMDDVENCVKEKE